MARRTAGALLVLVALLAWPGIASAASGVNITATESVSFTQRVANIESCVFNNATIDWGDGTPSTAGQFDTGTTPGVKGTHTYAEEGTYNGSVTYNTDCTTNGMVTFTATVGDVGLSAAGRDIFPTASQSITGVVSHFTDADPQGTVSDYSAQVSWGDGSQSAGTVSAALGGGFDVTGSHTYQSGGEAAVNVTITDIGGSSTQSSSTAHITAPPPPSGPLKASFSYPPAPCQGGPYRGAPDLDGSASQGAIATYRWTFTDWLAQGNTFVEDLPAPWGAQNSGALSWATPAGFFSRDISTEVGRWVHLLRPPTTVTLTVLDRAGHMDSTQQTITFGDPDEVFVVRQGIEYYDNTLLGWYVYWLDPVYPDHCFGSSGGPSHDFATGTVSSRPMALHADQSLTTTVSCPRGVRALNCGGTLYAVQPGVLTHHSSRARVGLARHKARTAPYLGRTSFLILAGGTRRVRIPLNKGGRRLAHARRLKRVTLLLVTHGVKPRARTVLVRRSKR